MAYSAWSVVFGEQPSATKWNQLGTNDASFNDGTGIAVSAITPEKLLTGTGTSWAWRSFTPSWTNLTVGNGTNTGHYAQIGKTVLVKVVFTLGSTSSMGSGPTITLPVTASSNSMVADNAIMGFVYIQDTGTTAFYGIVRYESTTTVDLMVGNAASTYLQPSSITSTAPMTWATGDILSASFIYEAA